MTMLDSISSDSVSCDFNRKLAHRLTALRLERGWTSETELMVWMPLSPVPGWFPG
jgi:hypothetical protein